MLAVCMPRDRMIPISFSYYADLELESPLRVEPGFMIDLTFPLVSNAKNVPTHYRELHFKPSIGVYQRKDYHTGMLIWTQLGYKAIRRSGLFWEFNAGPGYLHTFYNATVYVQNEDGSFSEKKIAGDAHLIAGGDLALGWDFTRKTNVPIALFLSGGFYGRYPHNKNWARHKFLKLGFSYVFTK